MPTIPDEIRAQKYISLATFRKNGAAVLTPVWFGEEDGKLYVMTRDDSGKYKRVRNNPQVKIAPCTVRGKITGPEFTGTARVVPPTSSQWARGTINRKYWAARIPFLWSKKNLYLEIEVTVLGCHVLRCCLQVAAIPSRLLPFSGCPRPGNHRSSVSS